MIRPLPFLALVVLLMFGAAALSGYLPRDDVFGGAGPSVAVDLASMPVSSAARLKLRHADLNPPFDVGLFGDSRSLPVSQADIGPAVRFFNFSLSGQSVRASVALLEALARRGKAPRIAVISLDHFELQYYGNPLWPAALERWPLAWTDLADGLQRSDVSWRDWLRMGWRHLNIESDRFRINLDARFVRMGFETWMGGSDPASFRYPYRPDGSMPNAVAAPAARPLRPIEPTTPQILPGYFRRDLQRLARVREQGVRIVLYETPLHGESAARFLKSPTAHAALHRRIFLDECRALGLDCHAAPEVFAPDEDWPDATHPPAAALGAYIRAVIASPMLARGRMAP